MTRRWIALTALGVITACAQALPTAEPVARTSAAPTASASIPATPTATAGRTATQTPTPTPARSVEPRARVCGAAMAADVDLTGGARAIDIRPARR